MKNSTKIALIIFLFAGFSVFGQEAGAVSPIPAERPMYEKFGMTPTELFSLMVIFSAILVGFIISLSSSLKKMLEFKKQNMEKGAKLVLVLLGMSVSGGSLAAGAEVAPATNYVFSCPDDVFWIFIAFDILCVFVILYLTSLLKNVASEFSPPVVKVSILANLQKSLTDVIPIEEEDSILLDHDYDGIRELDNNLPPWWKYGFYITIVWAVGYLMYYQVFQIGNLQEAEFLAEMEAGDRADEEYKIAHPELITPENVVLLQDATSIGQGKTLYTKYCFTCHMEGGKGGIGPNLTDQKWIYAGDIKGVFTTITNGAQNGMIAWKEFLPANEIQMIASYILQLNYVAPPIGKIPQGENIFN